MATRLLMTPTVSQQPTAVLTPSKVESTTIATNKGTEVSDAILYHRQWLVLITQHRHQAQNLLLP